MGEFSVLGEIGRNGVWAGALEVASRVSGLDGAETVNRPEINKKPRFWSVC